jgi:hypothetical protein
MWLVTMESPMASASHAAVTTEGFWSSRSTRRRMAGRNTQVASLELCPAMIQPITCAQ